MGRPATPPAEIWKRRQTWGYVRSRCPLDNAALAVLVGRSEDTVKAYGHRNGAVAPWDAIEAVKAHNLASAFEVIAERYGPTALHIFLEDA
jgi:hypothetical protein